MESKEQNKQTNKQKQTHRYREHFEGYLIQGGLGVSAKRGKEIKKYILVVRNCYGDRKYSIRDVANNIVTTMYSIRGVLDLLG